MTEQRAPEAKFTLERIYIKDISYESPAAPQALFQNVTPQIELQLSVQHAVLNADDGVYEVVVAVQASAKAQDKVMFLVELQQGGLFRIKGVTGEPLQHALQIACPNILLPFVREAISDLVGKGGFPPLLIQPINFETLYQNRKRAETATPAGHA